MSWWLFLAVFVLANHFADLFGIFSGESCESHHGVYGSQTCFEVSSCQSSSSVALPWLWISSNGASPRISQGSPTLEWTHRAILGPHISQSTHQLSAQRSHRQQSMLSSRILLQILKLMPISWLSALLWLSWRFRRAWFCSPIGKDQNSLLGGSVQQLCAFRKKYVCMYIYIYTYIYISNFLLPDYITISPSFISQIPFLMVQLPVWQVFQSSSPSVWCSNPAYSDFIPISHYFPSLHHTLSPLHSHGLLVIQYTSIFWWLTVRVFEIGSFRWYFASCRRPFKRDYPATFD